jgi:DNA polymerase-3 subunit delta'
MYEQLLSYDPGLKIFEDDVKAQKAHHAYIFECADKALYPDLFKAAASILMYPDGQNASDKDKIQRGVHPDVLFFPSQAETKIKAEDISEIIKACYIQPLLNDKKIFCIDATNSVNESWQNKILKILEEPPKNVIFLLAVENSQELLKTVISRCRLIKTGRFSHDVIAQYLESCGVEKSKAQKAAKLSGGSAAKAKYIAENPLFLHCLDDVTKMLINMESTKDIVCYLPILNKYKDTYEDLFFIMESLFRECVLAHTNEATSLSLTQNSVIIKICKAYTVDAAYRCIIAVEKAKAQIDRYINFSSAVDNLLLTIMEVKYRCRQ